MSIGTRVGFHGEWECNKIVEEEKESMLPFTGASPTPHTFARLPVLLLELN